MSAPGTLLDDARFTRELVTPEGVDLRIVLADAGARIAAFMLDMLFITLSLIALTIIVIAAGAAVGFASAEYLAVLWVLGSFFLRAFYFTGFEVTPRGATPGKRIVGIRVAARDGGALTADAVFARNAMREIEIFLPLSFLAVQQETVDAWIYLLGLVWCGVFLLFPLFNKDRLRIGDIVAGTWVVRAPKPIMAADLAGMPERTSLVFTQAQVDAYGIKELSVLEGVLREGQPETIRAVAARIRAKIGMRDGLQDREFLTLYYKALRARLESRLLFGRRKRDTFDKD